MLVFTKSTDEPDEPRQTEFKRKVGHYVNGRFHRSFSDPESLNVAVLAASRDVTSIPTALALERLPPPGAVAREPRSRRPGQPVVGRPCRPGTPVIGRRRRNVRAASASQRPITGAACVPVRAVRPSQLSAAGSVDGHLAAPEPS
ncbi:MAG TPA: hypothetical protein DHU96_14245 [Actinobacteria bacterium]|nr:hypothetical protein [Actinomycetota bacterium]